MFPAGSLHKTFGQPAPLMKGAFVGEIHSADGSSYIRGVVSDRDRRQIRGWDVIFQGVYMHRYRTREDARKVIRAYKKDPALAAVALVLSV